MIEKERIDRLQRMRWQKYDKGSDDRDMIKKYNR